jgi:hypothetical protein
MDMEFRFQEYFNDDLIQVNNLNHKGNNQLYEVITKQKRYLLKRYSTISKDKYNRGEVEFNAISYLWNLGFKEIPQPYYFLKNENIGIYSFEDGRVLNPEEIKEKDIINSIKFIVKLHKLGNHHKEKFALERTSCINLSDCLKLINNRINNLIEDFDGPDVVQEFLENEVIPKAKKLIQNLILKKDNYSPNNLELDNQVLTQGDFGFHNTLVFQDKYVYIDFEYFGRDDPVKQLLGFIHHDQTRTLSNSLKNIYLNEYIKLTSPNEDLIKRLKLLDPLFGLNFVLIYLNPFSKNYLKHLQFAHGNNNLDFLRKDRFEKAKWKLNNLNFFKEIY